jgi:uncharacterized protein (UPF0297 family)
MKIFYSSKKLLFDKSLNPIFLDIDNISHVGSNDMVMGVGSFRDELMVKSIINRGVLPFFVTLDIGLEIAPYFRYLSFILRAKEYFVTTKIVDKIHETKTIVDMLHLYNQELEREKEQNDNLKELLINNEHLIEYFILKKGQKGVAVSVDKEFNKLYIYERKGLKSKTIYVILQKNNYLKVFSQEVEKGIEVNNTLIKNRFNIKFKSLMESDHVEFTFGKNSFLNITSKYKKEFLLIDATNKRLLNIELLDVGLKLYSDIDFEDIAIYKLFSRNHEIDDRAKNLLLSIHNYLQDKGNNINDIVPFLIGHNLYEAKKDKDKRANIMADVFIKFIEKVDKYKKKNRISNFDFAIIALKAEFHGFDGDTLTNIFYHIIDGIGINAIIKKEFSQFIHNFSAYQDIVEEAEDELEFDECYDDIEEIVNGYPLDKRVMDIKHIDKLKTCLGESHELAKSLKRLYEQLDFQEGGEFGISTERTDDIQNSEIEKKDSYELIVSILLNTFLNMRGFDGIKIKSLALFMSYIAYRLSLDEREKSTDCCFFAFFNLYSDREPEYLLLRLEQYFKNRTKSVVPFFKEKESYICSGDKEKLLLVTLRHGDKSVKCERFRKQKSRKFKLEFIKVSNLFKFISAEDRLDLAVESFIDRVASSQLDTANYCNHEITINFLKIFFRLEKKCDVYLANFFDSLQKEYKTQSIK